MLFALEFSSEFLCDSGGHFVVLTRRFLVHLSVLTSVASTVDHFNVVSVVFCYPFSPFFIGVRFMEPVWLLVD